MPEIEDDDGSSSTTASTSTARAAPAVISTGNRLCMRITHLPSGIVVSMQNGSPSCDKEAALRVLASRLAAEARAQEGGRASAQPVRCTVDIRTTTSENRIADHRTGASRPQPPMPFCPGARCRHFTPCRRPVEADAWPPPRTYERAGGGRGDCTRPGRGCAHAWTRVIRSTDDAQLAVGVRRLQWDLPRPRPRTGGSCAAAAQRSLPYSHPQRHGTHAPLAGRPQCLACSSYARRRRSGGLAADGRAPSWVTAARRASIDTLTGSGAIVAGRCHRSARRSGGPSKEANRFRLGTITATVSARGVHLERGNSNDPPLPANGLVGVVCRRPPADGMPTSQASADPPQPHGEADGLDIPARIIRRALATASGGPASDGALAQPGRALRIRDLRQNGRRCDRGGRPVVCFLRARVPADIPDRDP